MQVSPQALLPAKYSAYYLFGEDRDGLFDAAEALLQEGEQDAVRLRVDISELGRIELESRSQGLFGAQACYALIRNAETATPKQTEHLVKLAKNTEPHNRLIICAAEVNKKKAMHKHLNGENSIISSEFRTPSLESFQSWISELLGHSNLEVDHDAIMMIAERLCGMRGAARQLLERMQLYDNGEAVRFDLQLVGDLLGERAPDDLESYCHAVAAKSPEALSLLRQLLHHQQVSDVQLLTWLSIRINQLLMYLWYKGKGDYKPAQAAGIFGPASKRVPQEVNQWSAPKLVDATYKVTEVEKLLKGASVEARYVVLERLTLELIS